MKPLAQTSCGNSGSDPAVQFVPGGHLTMAQRFSVGLAAVFGRVPKGRLNSGAGTATSAVPSGLAPLRQTDPTLKRWAIAGCPSGTKPGLNVRNTWPLRPILLIAAKEFGDRLRSGWVLACILVWLGAICLTSFLGLIQIGHIGAQGYERTVISLLNVVQYLVPLLGLLLGHDLIVNEKEEGTLRLILAAGVSRWRLLLGKFLGGSLTLSVPLLLGFAIAGVVITLATHDHAVAPFLRLAVSGLILGVVFLASGLAVSACSRTRVQSLVLALLAWCMAIFGFDLVALGWLVSGKSPAASREIELVCDATHVNAAADIHSEADSAADRAPQVGERSAGVSLGWLAINPVDLFRAVNLGPQLQFRVPPMASAMTILSWLCLTLLLGGWKLHRTDL